MLDIDELYQKIKNADNEGNLIIPKEYLRKFILTSLLTLKNSVEVDKDKIFNYLKDNKFNLPNSFDALDENKQQKYLQTLETLVKLFYLK